MTISDIGATCLVILMTQVQGMLGVSQDACWAANSSIR